MRYPTCLLVLLGLLAAGTAHAQTWEYKVTEVDLIAKVRVFANDLLLSADDLEEQLLPLGEDGWELVSTLPKAGGTQVLLVFKRPAPVVAAPAAVAPVPVAPAPVVAPTPVAPAAAPPADEASPPAAPPAAPPATDGGTE